MKRLVILAAVIAVGIVAPAASADPGAGSAAHRLAGTKTAWTATYNASSYYGEVKCTGKTTVNKKYPGGREVETCETTEGALKHMKAGKGQKAFENSEGGSVAEWESDSGSGKRTTEYSYTVNKKLTKFKLIAVYAP
jgi:hypothetical protein